MFRLVDQGQGAMQLWQLSNRWMTLQFRFLGGWVVLVITLLAVNSYEASGIAGIAIVSAQAFVQAVQSMCFEWTEL